MQLQRHVERAALLGGETVRVEDQAPTRREAELGVEVEERDHAQVGLRGPPRALLELDLGVAEEHRRAHPEAPPRAADQAVAVGEPVGVEAVRRLGGDPRGERHPVEGDRPVEPVRAGEARGARGPDRTPCRRWGSHSAVTRPRPEGAGAGQVVQGELRPGVPGDRDVVAGLPGEGSLDLDPELQSPGARRTARVARESSRGVRPGRPRFGGPARARGARRRGPPPRDPGAARPGRS